MVPYLKCIHQTLDSWRSGRKIDIWKLSLEELRKLYVEGDHEISEKTKDSVQVKTVTQLKGDLFALEELLVDEIPYRVPV